VLLAVIDRKWREHLYEMDYLQEGVGLRAYAQRDPVVEYQREGFEMFSQMMEGIKEEAVGFLFNLEVQVEEQQAVTVDPSRAIPLPSADSHVEIRAKGLGGSRQPQALHYSAPAIDGEAGSAGVMVESAPALGIGNGSGAAPAGTRSSERRPSGAGQAVGSGPSRNAPCYCGSGKKYKRCHGAPGAV
jgi:preprotein translocase subunit SecA